MTSTKELELTMKVSIAMEVLLQISVEMQALAMLMSEIAADIKRERAPEPVDIASYTTGTVQ